MPNVEATSHTDGGPKVIALLDVEKARSQFPALKDGYIFADNAGGSQCLKDVADKVYDYLLFTNVQLGADYSVSVASTDRVAEGPNQTAALINAASADEIGFGPSSTSLVANLAHAMSADVHDDEEIIVTTEHESNVGPWKKLAAARNLTIKTWASSQIQTSLENPYAVELSTKNLVPLITSKTRLVAFTACSNILGSIVDVAEVVRVIRQVAHEKGARKVEVCVDCVAYAPHRRIDVRKWDVDYCFFSYYKVYGPHTSVLYTRLSSLTNSLTSLAHHFLPVDSKAYKLLPGGAGYELTYASSGVLSYLQSLSPVGDIDDAFARIANHEQELVKPLLGYLTSAEARANGVRVVGNEVSGLSRAPTISFVVVGHKSVKSKDIVSYFDKKGGMGIRYGHFYAYTLVANLIPTIDADDGVVRISLVHYNTVKEANTLVESLKEALAHL